jgi:GNAT superfamily N-acetyltransferase
VPRPSLSVRPATPQDVPALVAFGEELRDLVIAPSAEVSRTRGGPAAARAEPLGMALLTVAPANALVDIPAVHMSHAVVGDRHKRRGAGRALVCAAASYAEQRGIEQLVVSVHPGSRDANRFFARLGFAPLAVRRTAPVAAVRRRLGQAEARPVADHVVRRPRSAVSRRASRLTSTLPLGPADADPAT